MVEAGKNGEPEEQVDVGQAREISPEFLGTLVHELRNPLGPIRNAAELLRTLCTDQRQLQSVEIISRQVALLTRALDDVNQALGTRQAELLISTQTVDIAAVVEPALRAVRPVVDARRQGLLVSLPSEPVHMLCDPVRLTQVVQTLLENATQQTHEGGTVALKVVATASKLMIEVADDGAGIASDRLPSVFNVFTRRTRVPEGGEFSALNLAVIRNIVELHGGWIEASSDGVGQGSRFIIQLPLAHEASGTQSQASAVASADSRRVLIIEDHEDNANNLRDVLAAGGHSVLVSSTGELGIALAQTFRPEVVVIDIGLPGLDGFEVAQRLREHELTANAVLVAVSGFSMKQFRDLSAYSAFRHYLLKPVNPDTILTIVDGLQDRMPGKPSHKK